MKDAELLSTGTVLGYLAGRGLIPAGSRADVRELGGGVSNVVLAVTDGDLRLLVKQALPRLRVADEWLAKRERAVTEAEFIRLAGEVTPGRVPKLVDVDPDACALVTELAPDGWRDWKADLLTGDADASVAEELGRTLAAWHGATAGDADVESRFDTEAFEQLRVDAYYLTVIKRRPDIAARVQVFVDQMRSTNRCLVHGDFSPKNVLVGPDGLWVIDHEVGHYGDPAFDLGFMLNHLMLKAVHRPQDRTSYRACAEAFLDAYTSTVPPGFEVVGTYVFGHVGCLMSARVDGKSPAEYLTDQGRERARTLGAELLMQSPAGPEGAWGLLETVL